MRDPRQACLARLACMAATTYKYSYVLGEPTDQPMTLDVTTVRDHMLRESEGGWELVNASTCAGAVAGNTDTVLCSMFWRKTIA
jgi:hypothetical protein